MRRWQNRGAMKIEKRTMNWLPRASAHAEATAAREKRRAMSQEFISQQSSLSSAFASTYMNKVSETVNITARAATARVTKTV